MKRFTIKNSKLQKIVFICFWLLLWEVAAKIIAKPVILPSVGQTVATLFGMLKHMDYYKAVLFSIVRVIAGVGLSILLGIVLGVLSGLFDVVYNFLKPVMSVIKSTPVVSFIILALVWMKTATIPIFVCFLMCVPIIWTNVLQGIRETDKKLLDMCAVYKVPKRRVIKEIYIPSLRGYIYSSVAAAVGIGWKSMIAAEVICKPNYAIGTGMYNAKIYLETTELFALTLTVIVLSFIFEGLVKKLVERKRQEALG